MKVKTAPARIPLRTHLAYMAGAVFTFILGLLLGGVATYAVASTLLSAPPPVTASGDAVVDFSLPDGASLKVDGERRDVTDTLELDPGRHEVEVLLEGQDPTVFSLDLTAGERRTVAMPRPLSE